MSEQNKTPALDLGSDPDDNKWDPFDEEDGDDDITPAGTAETPAITPAPPEVAATENPGLEEPADTEQENPLVGAFANAETKTAAKAQQGLFDKLPQFVYAGATEDITDTSQTFDELRIAKAADFPELEAGKNVTWTVVYGKITKSVTDTKGTSIGKMKAEIESSPEFLDALKKAKDKNIVCMVKPTVRTGSKGNLSAAASSYKDVFPNMETVARFGKVISLVPGRDGNVYEVRKTPGGTFITPTRGDSLLSEVKAGFIPALPLIPQALLLEIISFFRYFAQQDGGKEVLVNTYWDTQEERFFVDTPEQKVTKTSVHSVTSPEYFDERYIHYMDIHSHTTMDAFFSAVDDKDEKATRVYAVIGRLDKLLPDIKVRICNGGKFLEIDPTEVFEPIVGTFPSEWLNNVQTRAAHGEYKCAIEIDWPGIGYAP